ncbi:MAG TPA: zf-HC2 domain-containing protein [Holophagaceae bacterium]|jgi:anti-sigma factor RsiW|nr:zf-HC2 domain-containing protein [Holophagaceae bacterium]
MSSRHVTDLLPLWIEGDLDARESRAVDAHLAACGRCRTEAGALRESQAWLKSAAPPPFSVEDRDELRQAVLVRIQAPERRVPKVGWIASLAAAALLIVFLRPHRATAIAALPPAPPLPAPRSFALLPVVKPLRTVRHTLPPPLEPAAGPGASRIEIQTSNPQIRIIWLARATVQPEGSSPHSSQEDL